MKHKQTRKSTQKAFRAALEDAQAICESLQYDFKKIQSRRRPKHLVEQRMEIAQALRNKGYTTPAIGHALNRDHTTVMLYIDEEFRLRKNNYAKERYYENV